MSTSQLAAPLWVLMPGVASSWLPSSCLVQCIVHQLVQLHEREGPECVCVCVCVFTRGCVYTCVGACQVRGGTRIHRNDLLVKVVRLHFCVNYVT